MSGTVETFISRVDAKRSGKGWIAKCPAHDDREPSLSVNEGADGRVLLKCHAGCDVDSICAALNIRTADLFPAKYSQPSGNRTTGNVTSLVGWQACVEAFTERHVERLAKWRGYSIEFCAWLKENALVGLYDGCIAFPVHDRAGKVEAAHYRLKDGSWRYHPQGAKVRPLIIGELFPGDCINGFESTWDGLGYMDKSGDRDCIIITRGASNGRLVADALPERATLYLWPQNDAPGEKWAKDVCANVNCEVKRVKIPEPHKDLNDWTDAGAATDDLFAAMRRARMVREADKPLIEFRSPSQLQTFIPPPGIMLVGDCHIVKGSVFVIAGPPGVGKSRGSVALAIAGATGDDWFGLVVHRRFKTMIIQAENGLFRLKKEFAELDCNALENYVRVCPPPPFGMCFEREDFRAQLAAEIRNFEPDVIIFDPWNAAARDEKARDYLETFQLVRSVLPTGEAAPALGIIAHTRKPRADERATGRGLLNVLVGSYVLGSVPRCVFVMQLASDDPEDNRVVWTCCKNNDGDLGSRLAWERRNGLFARVSEFDWDTFDNPHKDDRITIAADDLAEIFEDGAKQLRKADAAKALEALTGAGRTACYNALKSDGRFARHLRETDGFLSWKP